MTALAFVVAVVAFLLLLLLVWLVSLCNYLALAVVVLRLSALCHQLMHLASSLKSIAIKLPGPLFPGTPATQVTPTPATPQPVPATPQPVPATPQPVAETQVAPAPATQPAPVKTEFKSKWADLVVYPSFSSSMLITRMMMSLQANHRQQRHPR